MQYITLAMVPNDLRILRVFFDFFLSLSLSSALLRPSLLLQSGVSLSGIMAISWLTCECIFFAIYLHSMLHCKEEEEEVVRGGWVCRGLQNNLKTDNVLFI